MRCRLDAATRRVLLLSGFFTGGTAAAGWTSYAPLSEDQPLAATGAGQDLWIVALVLIGTSSILGAINFLVTIFKMRAPGMTLFRMPIMVWTVLVTSVLVLMATPVITSALIMLFIDRNYGGAFFDPRVGVTRSSTRTSSGSTHTPLST